MLGIAYMRVLSSASATGPSDSSPGPMSDGVPGSSRCGSARCVARLRDALVILSSRRKRSCSPKKMEPFSANAWLTFPRRRMRAASSPLERSSTETYCLLHGTNA